MMRIFFSLLPGLLFSLSLAAQSPASFHKSYLSGSTGTCTFHTMLALEDGGFLLAGAGPDSAAFYSDALIVRTDAEGNPIWTKRYGKKGFNEKLLAAQKHPNGGFALSGVLERIVGPFQNLREDMLLIRLAANGDILWAKSVGDDDDDEQSNALKVDASGYFLLGRTFSDSASYMAPCVFRLDSSGNYISHNLVEDQDDDDYLLSWAPTSDGGFIGAGSTRSYGVGNGHIYLIRYSAEGNVLWTKTHAAPGLKSLAASIIPAGPGAYLIAGFAEVKTAQFTSSRDFLAMKITENGDSLWSRCYGNTDEDQATAIAPTPDGGFILAGNSRSNSLGGTDVFLVRINGNGDTLWTRRHGSSANDEANAVSVMPDGSIFWAGKWDGSSDGSRAVLVKCLADGNACFSRNSSAGIFASAFQFENFNNPVLHLVNPHSRPDTLNFTGSVSTANLCPNSNTENNISMAGPELFPNPGIGQFTIRCGIPVESVKICNPLGQIRHIDEVGKTEINFSEEIPGMYFLRIQTASGTFGRTLVVQR